MPDSQTGSRRPRLPRWLRLWALGLLGCAVLLVAIAVSLPAVVSSDRARSFVVARIQSATGRQAYLDTLRLSWSRGLEIGGLRVGRGDITDPDFLCALTNLRANFGLDSFWKRQAWISVEISGLSFRHQPAPAETLPEAVPAAQALNNGLQSLRLALQPVRLPADLRINVGARDLSALATLVGKSVLIRIPSLSVTTEGLRDSPLGLEFSAEVTADGDVLPPLALQAEVTDLLDGQRFLRPASARLSAQASTAGLDLEATGSLGAGLKAELRLDLAQVHTSLRPLLPQTLPTAGGRLTLALLAALKGRDALSASLALTAKGLSLSGGRLGGKSVGPLDLSLAQEIGADLAAGTADMPGSLSIREKSKASWRVMATGLSATPEFSLRLEALRLDLGDLRQPVQAFLPPDVKLSSASLEAASVEAKLRLPEAPDARPDLSASAKDLVLLAQGVQAGHGAGGLSVGGVEVRLMDFALAMPQGGSGTARAEVTAEFSKLRAAGPKPLRLETARLKRLGVSGADLRLSRGALFGLAGNFTVDMQSDAGAFDVAGRLSAPAITKSQKLTLSLPDEQRLALNLEHSLVDIPGLRLHSPGRQALALPLHIQASARGVTLTRGQNGGMAPAVEDSRLSAQVGQALHLNAATSLTTERRLSTQGDLALDADKLAGLLAELLPKRPRASGTATLKWDMEATLPVSLPVAGPTTPLMTRLRGLDFLHRAEATLVLNGLGLDLPPITGKGDRQETFRLRGLSTPRPLRLATTRGLSDSSLSGTLAFGPLETLPGVGALGKPISGLFTMNAAQQGLRSAQVSQMLSLDGFKLNENLSLTLDKLDALIGSADPLSTALERVDATGSFSLTSALDALPRSAGTGVSGGGSMELTLGGRLAGGRSLTLAAHLRSPGMDLRLGPDFTLSGLTSDLSLRRRYALRPGLACAGASGQEAQAPLSEQVFDLFPDAATPFTPAGDFSLRTLYDAKARRSGLLAFSALNLRSGPLPLSLSDFALALDTSGPLPAVQSFRVGLFGGNVLGRASVKGGGGAYTLNADCSFTGIDTARMQPGRAQKDLGDQAELSGKLSLRLPLTPDPEALLTRMTLAADITKVGPRTLERALYALDPDETNETIVQQRRLMDIGYPRNVSLRIAYGNLSLSGQVEVKGFRLDIPPIDRLSVANLPVRDQLGPALRPIPALLDMLDFVSATSICRDPSRPGKPGRFGSLNLSRTAPAQGATP